MRQKVMGLVKIKTHFQVTIPRELRAKFNIKVGEYVEVEDKNGQIVIKPVKVVHPDQEYFYTKDWQEGEAEADKDIQEGELIGPFDNIEDSLKALKNTKT